MKVLSDRWGRRLEKEVVVAGDLSIYPTEGSECDVQISEIRIEPPYDGSIVRGSVYFSDSVDGRLTSTLGGARHFLDCDVDRCLLNVYSNETCLVRIVYTDSREKEALRVSFRLRLEGVRNSSPPPRWDFNAKMSYVANLKEAGVKLIAAQKTVDAFRLFGKALKMLLTLDAEQLEIVSRDDRNAVDDLKLKLFNNLAHCQLQFQQYEAARNLCDKALRIDSDNVKALYRRGCSHSGTENWEAAYEDIGKVLVLDPNVAEAKAKMIFLKEKVKCINTAYKKTIKNMFI